jgi:two-component system, NarL family, invasion response regulator UvrY
MSTQGLTRVIVVDDHALIRRGMRETLAEHTDIRVIGEATEYGELRELLRGGLTPDVIVLDINLPGRDGIDVLKTLRAEGNAVAVLVVTMYTEDQYALRSLRAGANGYLHKSAPPQTLVAAVRQLAQGRRYLSAEIAELMAAALAGEGEGLPHEKLSDREMQTLKAIGSGKQLSEIAAAMRLSPKTVSVYRARLLEKMKLSTNAELTHYAIKHGLV